MVQSNLLVVCIASFSMVFLVLGVLALVMWVLIRVFPEKPAATGDTALIAAVAAAAAALYPGTRVTKVEEKR